MLKLWNYPRAIQLFGTVFRFTNVLNNRLFVIMLFTVLHQQIRTLKLTFCSGTNTSNLS